MRLDERIRKALKESLNFHVEITASRVLAEDFPKGAKQVMISTSKPHVAGVLSSDKTHFKLHKVELMSLNEAEVDDMTEDYIDSFFKKD